MRSPHHCMASRWGKNENSDRLYFLGLQNHYRWWLQSWNEKTLAIWKKSYDKPSQCIKKQRHHFADKDLYDASYGFSSSHVWMWELDHKESWELKNWCFWNVVWEKTLESPLGCKEIKPVNPKGNQPWIFIRRTDAEAEAPILWPPDMKSWVIGKDPDTGKDRGHEEKGATENEMIGWHHWLSGHEFEQTVADSEGRGSLAWCSPWSHKESDMTEQLNNKIYTKIIYVYVCVCVWIYVCVCVCVWKSLSHWVGKIPCKRKWQPIPVLLPGKFHGQRRLAGYSP